MTTVPLHAALVHVPLGLAIVLPLLSIGLAFALWRRSISRLAWLAVVGLQAALVLGGAAALWSGERDEDRVERITGEPAMESHEHAAQVFVWGASIVLAVAAAVTVVPARAVPPAAAIAAIGTLVVAGLAVRTGKAGGELVYARGGAAAYGPAHVAAASPEHDRRDRHHDDD